MKPAKIKPPAASLLATRSSSLWIGWGPSQTTQAYKFTTLHHRNNVRANGLCPRTHQKKRSKSPHQKQAKIWSKYVYLAGPTLTSYYFCCRTMDVRIAACYEQKLPCFIGGPILDSVSDNHIYAICQNRKVSICALLIPRKCMLKSDRYPETWWSMLLW